MIKEISLKNKQKAIINFTYQLALGIRWALFALGVVLIIAFTYFILQTVGIVK